MKELFKREAHDTVEMLRNMADGSNPLITVAMPIINLGLNKLDKIIDDDTDSVILELRRAQTIINKLVVIYDSEP